MANNHSQNEMQNDSRFEKMTGQPEHTRPERLVKLNDTVVPKLNERFGEDVLVYSEHRDELSVTIPKEIIKDVVGFLRDHDALKFNQLRDVHVVDWNRRKDRFEVIYNLFSMEHRMRLRVKCLTSEKDPHVDSVTDIYRGADWYEREAYDMHGVVFDGHPDLRRMYMPEDFVHPETGEPLYPLRKDFPVMGIPGSMPMPERNAPPRESKPANTNGVHRN